MAFLGPKIEKLAFHIVFMKGLKSKKINANFSILGPENAKKKTAEHICYTYINLWTTMKFGFQDKFFMKKPRQKLQGDLFS